MLDPHTASLEYALELITARQFAEAAQIIRWVVAEDPHNATAWSMRGHLAAQMDNDIEALYCYEEVLRLRPDDSIARQRAKQLRASITRHGLAVIDGPPGRQEAPAQPPPADGWLAEIRQQWQADLHQAAGQVRRLRLSTEKLLAAAMIGLLSLLLFSLLGVSIRPAGRPAAAQPAAQITLDVAGLLAVQNPTPTPALIYIKPRPTAAAPSYNYDALQADLDALVARTGTAYGYDLAVAFVDVQSGQVVAANGDVRMHAMSSFKGPLVAYYFWLLERGQITALEQDNTFIAGMLMSSNNPYTTCLFKRVGGIVPFNDWLAEDQGMDRRNNFVLKWQDWACQEDATYYIPDLDTRYTLGDDPLGLPGAGALLECGPVDLPCDKAFTAADLAAFYARLYRGEIITEQNTDFMLSWMHRVEGESPFVSGLPESGVRVYTKGGSQKATAEYRVNFLVEAGIIETSNGAYALAVFMQRNPDWPGSYAFSEAARLSYLHFSTNHP